VCGHAGSDLLATYGRPDHLKLRSSVTLFAGASEEPVVFEVVFGTFFGYEGSGWTRDVLAAWR